jgi:extradiol dioxygenase family protein
LIRSKSVHLNRPEQQVVGSSKFHLSLNVHDVRATAEFLTLLLGTKPDQIHVDYAKFELSDPAVVLSLVPTDVPNGAGLNHIGFRLPSHQALAALQDRLVAANVPHDCEASVACCHSRQTKFWVNDPAGNLWELYVLEEPGEAACEPIGIAPLSAGLPAPPPLAAPTHWAHQLGDPLPAHIPAADGSLDEIVLEGTLNATPNDIQPNLVLKEAARVLRAGGKLLLRGLTADRSLDDAPRLSGPAAAVEYVPTDGEVLAAVRHAGFVGLELVTFGEVYRFRHAGAELRETRVRAWQPGPAGAAQRHTVIYRGPFAEVCDDSGVVLRRGQRSLVDHCTWLRLQESAGAAQFVFVPDESVSYDARLSEPCLNSDA